MVKATKMIDKTLVAEINKKIKIKKPGNQGPGNG
jgi:hypothetical protein